jgi:hypothetical protein
MWSAGSPPEATQNSVTVLRNQELYLQSHCISAGQRGTLQRMEQRIGTQCDMHMILGTLVARSFACKK